MSVFVKYTTGKNLLDIEPIITGNKAPKIIAITEQQYYEYEKQKLEIDKYKSKIYKAIEYIKQNSELVKVGSKKHFDFYYREMKDVTELLEMLKGK